MNFCSNIYIFIKVLLCIKSFFFSMYKRFDFICNVISSSFLQINTKHDFIKKIKANKKIK